MAWYQSGSDLILPILKEWLIFQWLSVTTSACSGQCFSASYPFKWYYCPLNSTDGIQLSYGHDFVSSRKGVKDSQWHHFQNQYPAHKSSVLSSWSKGWSLRLVLMIKPSEVLVNNDLKKCKKERNARFVCETVWSWVCLRSRRATLHRQERVLFLSEINRQPLEEKKRSKGQ